MNNLENPLGYKPIGKLLTQFSVPAIISCLINSIYNIVDQIFIGQGVGYQGNAATTVAFPIMIILLAFGNMTGAGSSAFAAIRLGEGNDKLAKKCLNNAFVFSFLLGIIIMVLGIIFLKPLLWLFGAENSVIMNYSYEYTFIILLGTPFNLVSIALSNLARTDGNPRLAMYGMLIGAGINTILDPVYIFIFNWGVKGAAIATITSQIISAIILTLYFIKESKKNPRHLMIERQYLSLDFALIKNFLALGFSAGITQSAICIMQVVMNNSLMHYGNLSSIGGDVALSAMGIVMKISTIMTSLAVGVGMGAQPILGFNKGAKKYMRIRKTYLSAISLATILVMCCWIMCHIFPETIIGLFGKESEEFTDFAVNCMNIYLFGTFCAGFQIVSCNYFQATGQPLKAAILSTLRQLSLLVPLIIILPIFFGLKGILFSAPIADIVSAFIVSRFIIPEMKKLSKLEHQTAM